MLAPTFHSDTDARVWNLLPADHSAVFVSTIEESLWRAHRTKAWRVQLAIASLLTAGHVVGSVTSGGAVLHRRRDGEVVMQPRRSA